MDPNQITYFAETDARHKKVKFGIRAKDRLKHIYVIGKTGTGKSTFLENIAIQDIVNGYGLAFIDPYGEMSDELLNYVPEERIKDVIYFSPSEEDYPMAFNMLDYIDPSKRYLVSQGIISVFEKLWSDIWSPNTAYLIHNTLMALLEYSGSTLLSINKIFSDDDYREKVISNITDNSVKSFWLNEFNLNRESFNSVIPAILNKVGQFISNPLIKNIIGQSKSSFDIEEIMNDKKILIVNLSKNKIGESSSNLLGSLITTKIYLEAMSRVDLAKPTDELSDFYLFIDEFQSFANQSFIEALSSARKYKLALTIAHQYIEQVEDTVRKAIFGNVGTIISFRLGAPDAMVVEKEFAPVFKAEDLINLDFTQIYLKLVIDGIVSYPFSAKTLPLTVKPETSFKEKVLSFSRTTYSKEKNIVEDEIDLFYKQSPQKSDIPLLENDNLTSFISHLPLVVDHGETEEKKEEVIEKTEDQLKKNDVEIEKEPQLNVNKVISNEKENLVIPSKLDQYLKVVLVGTKQEEDKTKIIDSINTKKEVALNKDEVFYRDVLSAKKDVDNKVEKNILKDKEEELLVPISREDNKQDNNQVNKKEDVVSNVPVVEKKQQVERQVDLEFPKKFVKEVPEDVLRNLLKMD